MAGVFPDYPAPVVRNAGADRELIMMRWGMPAAAEVRRAARNEYAPAPRSLPACC
jgi:hypothetical protein